MEILTEKLYSTLSTVFKYSEFKSKQQREATFELAKRDKNVLIIMPTGSGKSLCYQLPAIALNCLAVVISPLIALIEDQVDYLKNIGVNVCTINSKMTVAGRREIFEDLTSANPKTNLLYLTPEMIVSEKIMNVLMKLSERNKLGYIVVDEAHCISQWGHDFRPKYSQITKLREIIPNLIIIAATATANSSVRADIIENLEISDNLHVVELSGFRSNLFYEVYYKDKFLDQDPLENLVEYIKRCLNKSKTNNDTVVSNASGIIYCRSRDGCEELAFDLKKKGIGAEAYHAGINNATRLRVQTDWMEGKFPVIVATVSFGMGIDKKNVRFVVHWTLPSGIMALYQESGRAGRDGLPSNCRLYYSYQERRSAEFILANSIRAMKNTVRVKSLKQQLECLIAYCEDYKCRHRGILHYLGEKSFNTCQSQCDVCNISHLRNQPQINSDKTIRCKNASTLIQTRGIGRFCYGADEKTSQFTSSRYLNYKDKQVVEHEEKAEMSNMIKQQLKLRSFVSTAKRKRDVILNEAVNSDNNTDHLVFPYNGHTIPNLTNSTRINAIKQISGNLTENRNTVIGNSAGKVDDRICTDGIGDEEGFQYISVNCDAQSIESKIMKNSRIMSNYFAGVVKYVRSIKDATKNCTLYVISQ